MRALLAIASMALALASPIVLPGGVALDPEEASSLDGLSDDDLRALSDNDPRTRLYVAHVDMRRAKVSEVAKSMNSTNLAVMPLPPNAFFLFGTPEAAGAARSAPGVLWVSEVTQDRKAKMFGNIFRTAVPSGDMSTAMVMLAPTLKGADKEDRSVAEAMAAEATRALQAAGETACSVDVAGRSRLAVHFPADRAAEAAAALATLTEAWSAEPRAPVVPLTLNAGRGPPGTGAGMHVGALRDHVHAHGHSHGHGKRKAASGGK